MDKLIIKFINQIRIVFESVKYIFQKLKNEKGLRWILSYFLSYIIAVWVFIGFSGFICGISYNIFCQDDINKKAERMTDIILNIEPMQKYTMGKVEIERGRKLIARSAEVEFKSIKEPHISGTELLSYLIKTGWDIKREEYDNTNKLDKVVAEKDKYMLTAIFYENKCHVSVHHDDFLYRFAW